MNDLQTISGNDISQGLSVTELLDKSYALLKRNKYLWLEIPPTAVIIQRDGSCEEDCKCFAYDEATVVQDKRGELVVFCRGRDSKYYPNGEFEGDILMKTFDPKVLFKGISPDRLLSCNGQDDVQVKGSVAYSLVDRIRGEMHYQLFNFSLNGKYTLIAGRNDGQLTVFFDSACFTGGWGIAAVITPRLDEMVSSGGVKTVLNRVYPGYDLGKMLDPPVRYKDSAPEILTGCIEKWCRLK